MGKIFLKRPEEITKILEELNQNLKSKKLFRIIHENPGLGTAALASLMEYRNPRSVRQYRDPLITMKLIELKKSATEMSHVPSKLGKLVHENLVILEYEKAVATLFAQHEKTFIEEFPPLKTMQIG